MNIKRTLSISIFFAFICSALFIKFIGFKGYVFDNYNMQNSYINFAKIAKNELKPDIHAVILIPNRTLKIIKIFKTPIGKIKNNKQNWSIIDSIGNLYETDKAYTNELITIEGQYKKWPKFYQNLKNSSILSRIYHIQINEHTANIWVQPGVILQIDDQIQHLEEFYNTFPELFKKGYVIDLRATNRVGISKLNGV